MTREIDAGPFHVERHPDGTIEAPERYIEADGQVIIRTRYSTIQRWTTPGWSTGHRGGVQALPYILSSTYCTGEYDEREPKNDELDGNQFSVYYVDDKDRVLYKVIE